MSANVDIHEQRFWPFAVLPTERRTPQHKRELVFLETAFRGGFRPWKDRVGNFGAATDERGGMILVRGRKRWEIRLGTATATNLSAIVQDFDSAAEVVLKWLQGAELDDMVPLCADQANPALSILDSTPVGGLERP